MSELLSKHSNLQIIQATGRVTQPALAKLDGLIAIVPHKIPALLWRQIPGAAALHTIDKRPGTSERLFTRLPNQRATGVWLQKLPRRESDGKCAGSYGLLSWAARVVAAALEEQPRQLGVLVLGFGPGRTERVLRAIALAVIAREFRMPTFVSKTKKRQTLKKLRLIGHERRIDLARTRVEADAINLARWLTALPANKLTAGSYRNVLDKLAERHGWKYTFHGLARLKKLGAGAFLAVAQGNADMDAGIAHLQYRPAAGTQTQRLALVGKGIIFDTGGTNLKPFKSMLDMHQDMGGSAVAIATLQALTELSFPYPVDCWLAITENRTGPEAYKSRDVVTALNGTTIEVIHTDAEGRMALADTLALAGRKGADLIIDYATLTGACHYALTDRYSGVFTNRSAIHNVLIDAGVESGERVWPFPMDEDYDDDLKSTVADVLQCSPDSDADQILAARFLSRFVPGNTPWLHIDLSAVTRKNGLGQVPPGETGFGIRFSLNLLYDQSEALQNSLNASLPVVSA